LKEFGRAMPEHRLDGALSSPAVVRNKDPILTVLRKVLPRHGTVLEIASGTGEHAAYFAAAIPELVWQPTDRDSDSLRSIAAHQRAAVQPNLLPPVELDVAAADWPVVAADAVLAINMVHISPWSSTLGLMTGAERILGRGGVLYLYGPYKEAGRPLAPSNAAFDQSLRERDPEWGLRDLDDVCRLAASHGLELARRIEMPANNLSLVFRRQQG
jgi:SAM-dependent methyltransferase